MTKVAVVGCGAIGLTTAVALQDKLGSSAKIQIFTSKVSPNTTSDIAAGLWEPLVHTSNSPEDKIVKWSMDTYCHILDLWKRGHAKEAGVTLLPVVKLTEEENYSLPKWLQRTLGYSELSADYLKKLSRENNKNFTAGVSFISFTWEAGIFLPYLQEQFISNGGSIVNRTISQLDELSEFDVIVNCSGFGARYLLGDLEVNPIRGQIARVYAPWQFHSVQVGDNYVIPNTNSVILGGTKQHDFNTNLYLLDTNYILNGCSNIVRSLENARVIKHQVGLRPGRTEVRLELEQRKIGGKIVKVLHSYGHGGSGITLCIGCANEAVDIIEEALQNKKCKL